MFWHSTVTKIDHLLFAHIIKGTILNESKRFGRFRFNWTNSEEPYFILDTLDSINAMMTAENNSLTSFIFAVNQKGRSPGVILRELSIGEVHRHAGKEIILQSHCDAF